MNQVFLGNHDPLLVSDNNLSNRLAALQQYEAQLANRKMGSLQTELVWDKISAEMATLSPRQLEMFAEDIEYAELTMKLNQLVQNEMVNLVKEKIENSKDGKELIDQQYKTILALKKKVVAETDSELQLFNKFREYSKDNPNATYEEFCKEWRNT